jgi:hypothetical protein
VKTSTFVSAVLGFALLTSAAGCAKTTDLGKMQEETIAVVKVYNTELEVLQRRYDELQPRRNVSPEADKQLAAANEAITEGRTLAASAPTTVATAAKTGNSDALVQAHDHIVEVLTRDIEIAKDTLAAFESYTNAVAYASAKPATIPAAVPPSTPVANPPTDSALAPGDTPGSKPEGITNGAGGGIACTAEIAMKCPEGQVDACSKGAATHSCVAK